MQYRAGRQVVAELGETTITVRILTGGEVIDPRWEESSDSPGGLPAGVVVGDDGRLDCGSSPWTSADDEVVTGFLPRVDDDVFVLVGRDAVPAAALVAAQLIDVVRRVEADHGPVALLTVIHPDAMSERSCRRVTCRLPASLDVRWRSRGTALMEDLSRRTVNRSTVALVHLGGATVEASLWEGGPQPRRLGEVVASRGCGGDAADDLVLQAVRDRFGELGSREVAARLRTACRLARHRLDRLPAADVVVPDEASGPPRSFRLVRSELQEITQPVLDDQLATLARAVERAGVEPDAITSILLTGGGATAPGTIEAFSTRWERPVHVVSRPSDVVAEDPTYVDVAPVVDEGVLLTPQASEGPAVTTGPALSSTGGRSALLGRSARRVPALAAVGTVLAMGVTASALPGSPVLDLLAGRTGIGAALDRSAASMSGSAGGEASAPQGDWADRLRSAVGKTLTLAIPHPGRSLVAEAAADATAGSRSSAGATSKNATEGDGPDASTPGAPTATPGPSTTAAGGSATGGPAPRATPSRSGQVAPGPTASSGSGTTSPPPGGTTSGAGTTPPGPGPTTSDPDPTTPDPDPTTPDPDPTTPDPDPTTPDPDPTTPDPDPTTADPDPDPTTPDPGGTTADPDPTPPDPDADSPAPEATTADVAPSGPAGP